MVDLTRVATTRGEADADEDWRGASAPPQNIRMPCGVCDEIIEIHDRLAFSGWTVHPRCELNTAEGACDVVEDRFRIEVIGEAGRPRRGAVHLVDFPPRLHVMVDSATSGGGGQQLRIARLWENVLSGAGDEGNEQDGGWRI